MSDISINTNIDSNLFENEYKYPEWYNKKKYIFYNKILARLNKLSYIHIRSSQYYDKMNYYIFGPSITITAISGIASFLSTSDFVAPDSKNAFGVAVGIIASISSVMQSIGGACQFSAKKEGHRAAAEEYNNLIVKTKFEIEMPNEENFADDLEQLILGVQNKCNYFPPQFIVEEYEAKKLNRTINNSNLNNSNLNNSNLNNSNLNNSNLNNSISTSCHDNVKLNIIPQHTNYNTFSEDEKLETKNINNSDNNSDIMTHV
jgi:hypothetical protein